jgi:hypothetical protein
VSLDTLTLGSMTAARSSGAIGPQSVEARDAMIEHGMTDGVTDSYDRLDDPGGSYPSAD